MMKKVFIFFTLVIFVLLCTTVSANWTFQTRSNPEEVHRIRFALKQQNLDKLESLFWEISNPLSKSYTQYLTISDITSIVAPPISSILSLENYLLSQGAQKTSLVHNQDYLYAEFTIADLEALFQVEMYTLHNHKSSKTTHRSKTAPKIPQEIQKHIEFITGVYDIGKKYAQVSPRSSHQVKQSVPATNAPLLQAVYSRGGNQLAFFFTPRCQDGTQPTNPTALCPKNPIENFTGSLTPHFGEKITFQVALDSQMCQKGDSEAIVCEFKITVDYYVPYHQVQMNTQFQSGSPSEFSEWDYMVVATPALVVRALKDHYGIAPSLEVTNKSITQCVVEFEQQYYNTKDLLQFFDLMGVRKDTEVIEIGYNDQTRPGGEANLDIQWIMGLAPGSITTFWSIYANSTAEIDDILEWALQMNNYTTVPLVNSLSYGMVESNVDKYLGDGYLKRSDVEFMKLALRGITLVFADGDSGASSLGGEPMNANNCSSHLHPLWPAQSPYVTAVGSTYLTPYADPICYLPPNEGGQDCSENPVGEVSVSMDNGLFWTTGGGTSWVAKRPSYQSEFVEEYLTEHRDVLPPSSMFNRDGRAFPDFATVGHNLMTVIGGEVIPVDGTSASTPIAAAMITLWNEERARVGLNPLGFINPLIYKIARDTPEAFNDVVVGENRCGTVHSKPVCCDNGYKATPGYDFVSGLGTPNFPVILEQVLKAGGSK